MHRVNGISGCGWDRRCQRGGAALSVVLGIMAIAATLAVGLSQIGTGETRRTAHEVRNLEARVAAEAALDRAATRLRRDLGQLRSTAPGGWMEHGAERWHPCAAALVAPPCGDGTQNRFDERWVARADITGLIAPQEHVAGSFGAYYVAPALRAGDPMPSRSTIHVIGEGQSSDGSAHVRIVRTYAIRPLVGRVPDAPVIAAGDIAAERGLTAIGNPDGAGAGIPLSIWAGGPARATPGYALETCGPTEYLAAARADLGTADTSEPVLAPCPECRCPEPPAQTGSSAPSNTAILDERTVLAPSDAGTSRFPTDLFQYVFGVPGVEAAAVMAQGTVLSDCAGLGPESSGLLWIRGDCVIAADTAVGSPAAPVALVVQHGSLQLSGEAALIGIVVLLDPPEASASLRAAGTATIYGALISTGRLEIVGDRFIARYERQVLENLADTSGILLEVPGTWKDYR